MILQPTHTALHACTISLLSVFFTFPLFPLRLLGWLVLEVFGAERLKGPPTSFGVDAATVQVVAKSVVSRNSKMKLPNMNFIFGRNLHKIFF